MDIAREAGRRAAAPPETETAQGDPTLMYSRAARAVRQSVALQMRLLKELDALDKAGAAAEAAQVSARKHQIRRLVRRAIGASYRDASLVSRLGMAVWERLVDEDDDEDLAHGPIDEIVARICADLGLPPDATARAMQPFGGMARADQDEAKDYYDYDYEDDEGGEGDEDPPHLDGAVQATWPPAPEGRLSG